MKIILLFFVVCVQWNAVADIQIPSEVTVTIHGAIISPIKFNESPWDGSIALKDVNMMSSLISLIQAKNNYETIALEFAKIAASGVEAPDVSGTAFPIIDNKMQKENQCKIAKLQDNFTPNWTCPSWILPFNENSFIEIFLEDQDLRFHDTIGTVILNIDDLKFAYQEKGKITYVAVNKQGTGQILAILISVR